MLINLVLQEQVLAVLVPIREKIMKETGKNHNYIFIRSNGEPAWNDCESRNKRSLN